MKNVEITSKKVEADNFDQRLCLNGDLFIIPNSLRRSHEFPSISTRDNIRDIYYQMSDQGFKLNDIDEELWIQVWIVVPDISENLNDHGFTLKDTDPEGKKLFVRPQLEFLPLSIFTGKKEGDEIVFDISGFWGIMDGEKAKVNLKLKLKLQQLKYRYNSFGPFQEVMNKLSHNF